MSKWTQSQQEVIDHKNGNLLVSASAGSGKTSVLIEKIVQLILHGNVHLKNLLVVTFTNSASLEIKQRLQKSLEETGDKTLLLELEDLWNSDILTFDGFCIKVIKEFGYEIGQNNNFSVADNSLSGLLQNQALDNLLSKYSKKPNDKFLNILETFFENRNDKSFRSGVISLYNFLRSKNDDVSYQSKLDDIYDFSNNSEAIKFLNAFLITSKNNFKSKLDLLYTQSNALSDDAVSNAILDAKYQIDMLGNDFFINFEILKNGFNFSMPRKSKKDIVEILEIKESVLKAKNEFVKDIDLVVSSELKSISNDDIKKDLEITKQRLQYLFEIVEDFEKEYSALKANMQVLDFVDIEQKANKILCNKQIATSLQNKYDWIFIDEYQDTSLLQESIVKKITTGDNLFMVGDFKQSIYRFRQAEPKIFINKYNQYKKMQNYGNVIDLKTNFRSEKPILDFNNFVFDKIYKESIDEFEYKGNADLEFGGTAKSSTDDSQVKILIVDQEDNDEENIIQESFNENEKQDTGIYSVKNSSIKKDEEDSITRESLVLAKEILSMIGKTYYDAKNDVKRPITFGDIAVLSRGKNNVLPSVKRVLNKAGIPVNAIYEETLFENYDMQILLDILKTIQNHHNDYSLLSALSNIGKLSFDELSQIRQLFRQAEFFYQAVDLYISQFDDIISIKLKAFFEKINDYKNYAQYNDICSLIIKIVQNENLHTYFAVNNMGEEFENHLRLLIDSIQSIKNYNLFEFVNYLDTFGQDFKFDSNIKDGENSITLSTIHKSKGLEYPVVFLIGAGKQFSTTSQTQKILMDNDWGISMPSYNLQEHRAYQNFINKSFKLKIRSENRKEEKRLLYVALTRAKNYLTIIGSNKIKNINSLQGEYDIFSANSFMKWILGCLNEQELQSFKNNHNIKIQFANSCFEFNSISKDEIAFTEKQENKPAQSTNERKEKLIDILSQKFPHNNLAKKSSVSQIMEQEEHYNITDLSFNHSDKQNDLDFLAIGTAYHKYMELLEFVANEEEIRKQIQQLKVYNQISEEETNFVDEEKIIIAIKQIAELIDKDDIVLKEQQFLSYFPANMLVDTEKQNRVLVQGVADLIIIKQNQIILIDYKTSRLKESEFADKYRTQLGIYSKAIQAFYKKDVSKKLIYSFYLDKLITI